MALHSKKNTQYCQEFSIQIFLKFQTEACRNWNNKPCMQIRIMPEHVIKSRSIHPSICIVNTMLWKYLINSWHRGTTKIFMVFYGFLFICLLIDLRVGLTAPGTAPLCAHRQSPVHHPICLKMYFTESLKQMKSKILLKKNTLVAPMSRMYQLFGKICLIF